MTETKVNKISSTCLNKTEENPEEKQDPKKHWLKCKVEDEDKKLLENVEIDIVLPDDCSERRSYDKKRDKDKSETIVIMNIEPGSCSIESDWRELIKKRKTVFDSVLFISSE